MKDSSSDGSLRTEQRSVVAPPSRIDSKLIRSVKQSPIRWTVGLVTSLVVVAVAVTCIVVFGRKRQSTETISSTSFVTTNVAMRDGVKLAVDYVTASGNERLPVILEVTPYGRGPAGVNYRYEAPFWYGHGYLVVVADCRGTGDSEGSMNFFAEEGRDGYDLIEWIARQPWSNGRVSMRGSSYTGTNQWLVAREQPPHLSCITPSATIGRSMEDFPYRNGAFGLHWALNWIGNDVNIAWPKPTSPPHPNPPDWLKHRPLQTMDVFVTGHELPLYRTFLEHPTYDDYWRRIDFTEADFAKIQIPALAFTGWFDGTMHGTIWRFQQARLHAARKADQFLIVGPYTHGNAADGGYNFMTGEPMLTVGDLAVATDAVLPGLNMTRDFFNWCLKDGPRPAWAPVRIFITGSDRWMSRDIFPPPEVQQRSLFLNSAGRLQWDAPQVASLDRYVYDPNNPLFMHNYSKPLGLPVDMNALLDRDDVLIYTTVPMNQSLTVVGDVVIELTIFSSALDTDFVVQLMDVWPDGRSIKLSSKAATQARTRYRDGFDREVLMVPGTPYQIRVMLREIGHTFLPQHRIRLAVTSSFYPWISVNPNTGGRIATDTALPLVANQTIYYNLDQPSRITLSIIDTPNFDR